MYKRQPWRRRRKKKSSLHVESPLSLGVKVYTSSERCGQRSRPLFFLASLFLFPYFSLRMPSFQSTKIFCWNCMRRRLDKNYIERTPDVSSWSTLLANATLKFSKETPRDLRDCCNDWRMHVNRLQTFTKRNITPIGEEVSRLWRHARTAAMQLGREIRWKMQIHFSTVMFTDSKAPSLIRANARKSPKKENLVWITKINFIPRYHFPSDF